MPIASTGRANRPRVRASARGDGTRLDGDRRDGTGEGQRGKEAAGEPPPELGDGRSRQAVCGDERDRRRDRDRDLDHVRDADQDAVTDELHQASVSARNASVVDVGVDVAGAVIALLGVGGVTSVRDRP